MLHRRVEPSFRTIVNFRQGLDDGRSGSGPIVPEPIITEELTNVLRHASMT